MKRGMHAMTFSGKSMQSNGRLLQALQTRNSSSINKPEPKQTIDSSSHRMSLSSWLLRRSKYFVAASFGMATLDGMTCGLGLLGYILMNECGYAYTRKRYNVPSIPVVCRIPATDIATTVPVLRVEYPGSYLDEARVACGGAASCLFATAMAGTTGLLLDSHTMSELFVVGAHFSAINTAFPVTSFDAWRYSGPPERLLWNMQGWSCIALLSLPILVPNVHPAVGGVLGSIAACATIKEWLDKYKQKGYYQKSDDKQLKGIYVLQLLAIVILYACNKTNLFTNARKRVHRRRNGRIVKSRPAKLEN